jgi:Mn2+/Fe2+ NRAMP family transporter
VVSSVIILVTILLMSWLLQDKIQVVLNFTGGIFGIFILFLMPCIEVFYARKKVHEEGKPKNYLSWLPLMIFVLGVGFMVLNLYHIISKM